MAYQDLVDPIAEALGVSSAHGAGVLAGVVRNARFFLRNYNFRESVVRFESEELEKGASTVPLPADLGKIKAVRLWTAEAGSAIKLYKKLRRGLEGDLPQRAESGPMLYWIMGSELVLDTEMPAAGYFVEIWYQTIDPAVAEGWLSTSYGDVLEHRTIYELSPRKRKSEVMQTYSALWQEDQAVLANYLQEIEWGDLDMRMAPANPGLTERYPSS